MVPAWGNNPCLWAGGSSKIAHVLSACEMCFFPLTFFWGGTQHLLIRYHLAHQLNPDHPNPQPNLNPKPNPPTKTQPWPYHTPRPTGRTQNHWQTLTTNPPRTQPHKEPIQIPAQQTNHRLPLHPNPARSAHRDQHDHTPKDPEGTYTPEEPTSTPDTSERPLLCRPLQPRSQARRTAPSE